MDLAAVKDLKGALQCGKTLGNHPKPLDNSQMLTTSSLGPSSSAETSSPASRHPRWSSLAKPVLGAIAVGALTAGQAQAIVVNVNNQSWDVTTFTGSYDTNTTKFDQPPSPGVMPWWGSQTDALAFANAVRNQLPPSRICTECTPITAQGPYFGFGTGGPRDEPIQYSYFQYPLSNPETGGGVSTHEPGSFISVWAQVVPTAPPAPGPLPALGAAAAFGFSRQLRKLIKSSRNAE